MTAISIVIPTCNRLQRLQRVLEGLSRQTISRTALQVIVVSDGSTDGTDRYLRDGSAPLPVTVALQDNQGPAAARNHGIALADSDLVLFLDDDVVPTPGLVRAHVDAHRREGPDVVVLGTMLNPPGFRMSPWVRYEQAMLSKQYDAMARGLWSATARQFFTGNASLERHHLVASGGFDTSFTRAEDVELAYRLADRGLRFVFVPQACGHHFAERRYESWRTTAYTYGRNDIVFARDKGQEWLLSVIDRELGHHHPLVRLLVNTTLDHPWVHGPAVAGFGLLAAVAPRLGAERVSMAALSAVYNASYYRGVADEAGSGARPGRLTNPVAPLSPAS